MKKIDVVLGLQWGDEGKGKVVDVLTPNYNVIARFQGGPNAGHSLVFNNDSFVLHTVPSGIFRKESVNIIGNGVVIDPVILMDEIKQIETKSADSRSRLMISKRAQLILPTHRMLDAANESSMGKSKIGSTLKGIGPTYMDKIGRYGLRIGDILLDSFKEKYEALKKRHMETLKLYPDFKFDITEYEAKWFDAVEQLKSIKFVDSEHIANEYINDGKAILAEGAQGSMLDIDFGTYPFVTSSNTMTAGVCTGLGVAPNRVGNVYGIFKAYCTRVGNGPFPTELNDQTGEDLRQAGHEFGATTGRPRRCGWLDLVALKYAVMMNGVTDLIMMKSDVLNSMDTIKVAVAYKRGDETMDTFPYDGADNVEPIYKEFEGWKTDICDIRDYDSLPEKFREYVAFIEKETSCPVRIISIGPDREATIFRN